MSKRFAYRSDRLLTRRGSCPTPDKRGYNLRSSAKAALRMTHERGAEWRQEGRIYPCQCGHWHLTSMELTQAPILTSAPLPKGLAPGLVTA